MSELKEQIEKLCLRIFESAGSELLDLKITGPAHDIFIQVIADKPSGGISIGDCVILNRLLKDAIENEGILEPQNFSLELSSPGLDRPLVSFKDFKRVKGQEIHFWLNESLEGKKELQGVLTQVQESAVTIEVLKGRQIVLPLSIIIKGMLVV
ncbi:MAG: hypothetical protein HQL13_00210 [Candidatus Omnitrophica bacterium]|nr:hypothetical protein [Candidatus Omnitrophota bacterium]